MKVYSSTEHCPSPQLRTLIEKYLQMEKTRTFKHFTKKPQDIQKYVDACKDYSESDQQSSRLERFEFEIIPELIPFILAIVKRFSLS